MLEKSFDNARNDVLELSTVDSESLEQIITRGGGISLAPQVENTQSGVQIVLEGLKNRRLMKKIIWCYGLGGIILAGDVAGAVTLALTTTPGDWYILPIGVGLMINAPYFLTMRDHSERVNSSALKRQAEKAQNLIEHGYKFAFDLWESHVLPMQAEQADAVEVGWTKVDEKGWENWKNFPMYAVKPSPLHVPVVRLEDLRKPEYVGRPVIVPATISETSSQEDMKVSLDVDLVQRVFIFSGYIRGSIEGDIHMSSTQFRISNGTISVPALVNHLPNPNQSVIPPYRVVQGVSGLKMGPVVDRNEVVHFLREADRNKHPLLLAGKVDGQGRFHAEAIADTTTKNTMALAVYQGPIDGKFY